MEEESAARPNTISNYTSSLVGNVEAILAGKKYIDDLLPEMTNNLGIVSVNGGPSTLKEALHDYAAKYKQDGNIVEELLEQLDKRIKDYRHDLAFTRYVAANAGHGQGNL